MVNINTLMITFLISLIALVLGFLIYGIRPTEKPSSDFFAVMHELGSIGSNLSSIWLCASTHEHPDEELFHQFSLWQQDTSAAMIYLI